MSDVEKNSGTHKPEFAGEWVRLGDLCTKGKSSLRQKDLKNDGPYLVYGASGVVGTSSEYQNEEPYVAVVKDGAGVGRVMACEPHSSVLGTMQALLPNETTDRDYLLHLVESLKLGQEFTGSTIPHIYFKDYGKTPVKALTIAKQTKVASALNQIDRLVGLGKQQLSALDDLAKSQFVEMFGDATSIASKWNQIPFGECLAVFESGNSPSCSNVPREGDNPAVLKLSALSSGRFTAGENKAMLEGEGINPDKEVKRGDILIARKNTPELVGSCVIVRDEVKNLMFPDIVFRAHPRDNVSGEYLCELLSGPSFSGKLKSLAHGSAKSMSNISKTALERLPVPLPPLALQQQFADFVAEVDKLGFDCYREIVCCSVLFSSMSASLLCT